MIVCAHTEVSYMKKIITLIGGGTGNYTLLTGLKTYSKKLTINVIVTTADSGGSTGNLRDQYGVLPAGDIAKCLVALSDEPEEVRKALMYRFETGDTAKVGDVDSHTLMNLIMASIEKTSGRKEIIRILSRWWNVTGRVIPVSYDNLTLMAKTLKGQEYRGEHLIDRILPDDKIASVYYEQPPAVNPIALEALAESDMIILSPGDVYTSTMPVLIIEEIGRIIRASEAVVLLVVPLVNKFGHTDGYTVQKYVEMYSRVLGGRRIDLCLYNSTEPQAELVERYKQEGEVVRFLKIAEASATTYMGADLLDMHQVRLDATDTVKRSLIRHDPHKTAAFIYELVSQIQRNA